MKKCLVTIIHDPDNKLYDITTRLFPDIRNLFTDALIKVTPATDRMLTEFFSKYSVTIVRANSDNSNGRLLALKSAYNLPSKCDLFFYIDFDRLLYWQTVYPGELKQVVCGLQDEITVIGRTKAAFGSHPELQRLTEQSANALYGYDVDILGGCRSFPRGIAKRIIKESKPTNIAQVDAEWLKIANDSFRYIEVNGLGYEHNLLNLEKPKQLEVKTRIENLYHIARYLYDW